MLLFKACDKMPTMFKIGMVLLCKEKKYVLTQLSIEQMSIVYCTSSTTFQQISPLTFRLRVARK